MSLYLSSSFAAIIKSVFLSRIIDRFVQWGTNGEFIKRYATNVLVFRNANEYHPLLGTTGEF